MFEWEERLIKIMREEYGITTVEELDVAIKKLGTLDITVFCKPLKKEDNP